MSKCFQCCCAPRRTVNTASPAPCHCTFPVNFALLEGHCQAAGSGILSIGDQKGGAAAATPPGVLHFSRCARLALRSNNLPHNHTFTIMSCNHCPTVSLVRYCFLPSRCGECCDPEERLDLTPTTVYADELRLRFAVA